jgi:hypothetical protein
MSGWQSAKPKRVGVPAHVSIMSEDANSDGSGDSTAAAAAVAAAVAAAAGTTPGSDDSLFGGASSTSSPLPDPAASSSADSVATGSIASPVASPQGARLSGHLDLPLDPSSTGAQMSSEQRRRSSHMDIPGARASQAPALTNGADSLRSSLDDRGTPSGWSPAEYRRFLAHGGSAPALRSQQSLIGAKPRGSPPGTLRPVELRGSFSHVAPEEAGADAPAGGEFSLHSSGGYFGHGRPRGGAPTTAESAVGLAPSLLPYMSSSSEFAFNHAAESPRGSTSGNAAAQTVSTPRNVEVHDPAVRADRSRLARLTHTPYSFSALGGTVFETRRSSRMGGTLPEEFLVLKIDVAPLCDRPSETVAEMISPPQPNEARGNDGSTPVSHPQLQRSFKTVRFPRSCTAVG